MNRTDNKIEMKIISEMDMTLCSQQRKFIKRIYTDKPPKKTRNIDEIMDGLILMVHERNLIENRTRKRWDEGDIRKIEFINGQINAICFILGLDTRL